MKLDEFTSIIRQKYPNGVTNDGKRYIDLSDRDLAQRIVQKYPVYAKQIDFSNRFESSSEPVNTSLGTIKRSDQAKKISNFVGGEALARGAGLGLASKEVQEGLSDAELRLSDTALEIHKKINEKKRSGGDTSRLEKALKDLMLSQSSLRGVQEEFISALPSNKEVLGSAAQLATTATAGSIAKGASSITGANKASSVLSGTLRGAGAGALTGSVTGGAYGLAEGLKSDEDIRGILGSGVTGSVIGGIGGGVIGAGTGAITGKLRGNALAKAEAERIIKSNPDSTVAKYRINGQGQLVKDPVAQEAIKQGVDEGVVATVKGSSSMDKAKMSKMLDILEQGKKNPKYSAINRPSDVIGDSVLERYKIVQTANKKAAEKLDIVAKSLRGKTADPVPSVQSFIQDLDDMGIKFKDGKAVFQGSQIEGLKEPQQIINRIVDRLKNVSDDAYELHTLKKFIDEQVSYGKSVGGLTGKTEKILKGLRAGIDTTLDNTFPTYNKVNTTFSTTKGAIDDFIRATGTKFNPNAENANARLGTLARRILSNAQSRAEVLNSLNNLQKVAEANGGKFSDDLIAQTVFVNDLERLFGTSAPTSLAGEVSKGVQRAGTIASKLKNTQGIFDLALQLTGEGIEKARGINQEGLLKAIRLLLK